MTSAAPFWSFFSEWVSPIILSQCCTGGRSAEQPAQGAAAAQPFLAIPATQLVQASAGRRGTNNFGDSAENQEPLIKCH